MTHMAAMHRDRGGDMDSFDKAELERRRSAMEVRKDATEAWRKLLIASTRERFAGQLCRGRLHSGYTIKSRKKPAIV